MVGKFNPFMNLSLLLISNIFVAFQSFGTGNIQTDSRPSRISQTLLDLGGVHRIYLSPALVSVVQLPYPITETKVGDSEDLQVQLSKSAPEELTLTLRRGSANPTNVIVRCGSRIFVFDVIPSKAIHQDFVKITGTFGYPNWQNNEDIFNNTYEKIMNSGEEDETLHSKVLLDSSERKKGK